MLSWEGGQPWGSWCFWTSCVLLGRDFVFLSRFLSALSLPFVSYSSLITNCPPPPPTAPPDDKDVIFVVPSLPPQLVRRLVIILDVDLCNHSSFHLLPSVSCPVFPILIHDPESSPTFGPSPASCVGLRHLDGSHQITPNCVTIEMQVVQAILFNCIDIFLLLSSKTSPF